MNNEGFQNSLMEKIGKIGMEVEKICKGEFQDIEGCYAGDKMYVVQTRPQV